MADAQQPGDLAPGQQQPLARKKQKAASELSPTSLDRRRANGVRSQRKHTLKLAVERVRQTTVELDSFWHSSTTVTPTGDVLYYNSGTFASPGRSRLFKEVVMGVLHLILGGHDRRLKEECEMQLPHRALYARL
jgi:hypothetical protein